MENTDDSKFIESLEDSSLIFYTIQEAAEILHTTPSVINSEIHQRNLGFVQVGRQIRISKLFIEEYCEKYKDIMMYSDWRQLRYILSRKYKAAESKVRKLNAYNKIGEEQKYYIDDFYDEAAIIKEIGKKYDYDIGKATKLRELVESLHEPYYAIGDIMKILKLSYSTIMKLCQTGTIKSVNPDGHKWFIDIDAFNNLNPEDFPEKCRKHFEKYLKKIAKE
jgi:excisionase family DNA binding protein